MESGTIFPMQALQRLNTFWFQLLLDLIFYHREQVN